MIRLKAIIIISVMALFLIACGAQGNEPQPELEVTSGPLPSIEILTGSPNTCMMADTTQSTVMGFDVNYHNMGTDSYMVGVMSAPDVGEIGNAGTPGEGRDGEGNWGIYPEFYDLSPNTPITLEITVHAGIDENAPVSSKSSLTYNCTTGNTITSSYDAP